MTTTPAEKSADPGAERDALLTQLGLNTQNKGSIGRLLATGQIGQATDGPNGRMSAEIHIRPDELTWDPQVLVLPHAGTIDIEMMNDDTNTHCALMPSNGDAQWIWLPVYSKGTVTLTLDGPGYYWFSSNIGNDEGRGMTGAIVVLGDVPESARLDRPQQPRP